MLWALESDVVLKYPSEFIVCDTVILIQYAMHLLSSLIFFLQK